MIGDGGKAVPLTILYRDHYPTLSIADHSSGSQRPGQHLAPIQVG